MATFVQTFQATLPLGLFDRLQRIRRRYQAALKAAAAGDFSREPELASVSRSIGHLLAEEARKSPEERGGLRMLDISIAVDKFFPELRGWNQRQVIERVERMANPLPLPVIRTERAS
ncbi:MAG TPA: hypothetical protein VD902_07895 [Symbiobacteriaceae bacterium]|nr:hypothetical protein [Symbiobacteriaceae bacterium]